MAQVDSLEILITADAEKANSAIDALTKKINSLQSAFNGLGSDKGIGSLATALGKIRKAVDAFGDGSVSKLDSFTNSVSRLVSASNSHTNDGGFQSIANGIRQISSALKSIKDSSYEGVDRYTDAIRRLLSATSSCDTAQLQGIASGLLHLSVSSSTASKESSSAIGRITDTIIKLNTALGTGTNYESLRSLSDNLTILIAGLGQVDRINEPQINYIISSMSKLARINEAGGLNSSASGIKELSVSLSGFENSEIDQNFVDGLSKLIGELRRFGNSSMQRASENIPVLTRAIEDMVNTFSSLPDISDNLTSVISSVASLSQNMNSVRSSTNGANTAFAKASQYIEAFKESISKTANNIRKLGSLLVKVGSNITTYVKSTFNASDITNKLRDAFWKLFRTIKNLHFAIERIKNVWQWLEKSMDMIEAVNYFNAAMQQVASRVDTSTWEQAGYDSATSYANSFYDTYKSEMTSLMAKMTGYTVNADDSLSFGNTTSLGLNPSTLLQYQTGFAQIASSMGMASDTAVTLSNVMTELGADIASVRNMDFETVWENLQSGLVGQSRVLDKYGINIRQAALEQVAMNLGIEKSVSTMSQSEKAMLRMIVILNSTEYAYGDLAETIQSPANQIRLLSENFTNLGRTIGNIFIPIVAKLLPVLNSLVTALQRMFEYVLSLLSVFDTWANFDWGGSSDNSSISDLISDTLDENDALESATDSAKELKRTILGFDEINAMSSNNDDTEATAESTSDLQKILDALNKSIGNYQSAWDKAFEGLENSAGKFADAVAEAFKKSGLFGVGEFFAESITKALKKIPWDSIFKGAETFGSKVAEFLNGLTNPEMFYEVGKTLANLINTMFHNVASFVENYDFGKFGRSISQNLLGIFENIDWATIERFATNLGRKYADYINGIFDPETFKALGKTIGNALNSAFDYLYEVASNLDFKRIGESIRIGITTALDTINWDKIFETARKFGTGLADFLNSLITVETFSKIGATIANVLNTVILFGFSIIENANLDEWSSAIAELINSAVERFDFAKAGEIVGKLVHTLLQAFLKLDLTNIAEGIKIFLSNAFGQITASDCVAIIEIFAPRLILAFSTVLLGQVVKGAMAKIFANMIASSIAEGAASSSVLTTLATVGKSIASTIGGGIAGYGIGYGVSTIAKKLESKYGDEANMPLSTGTNAAIVGTGTALGTMFGGIPGAILGTGVGFLVAGLANDITSAVNKKKAQNAGTQIGTSVSQGVSQGITSSSSIITSASNEQLATLATTYSSDELYQLGYQAAESISTGFRDFVQSENWNAYGRYIILGVSSGMADAKETVLGAEIDVICDFIENRFKTDLQIHSPSRRTFPIGQNIIAGIIEGMNDLIPSMLSAIGNAMTNLVNSIGEKLSLIKQKLANWSAETKIVLSEWAENTKTKFSEWSEAVGTKFDEWKQNISDKFKEWKQSTKDDITEWYNDTVTKFAEWVTDIGNWFSNLGSSIGGAFQNAYQTASTWLGNLATLVSDSADSISSSVSNIGNAISTISATPSVTSASTAVAKAAASNLSSQTSTSSSNSASTQTLADALWNGRDRKKKLKLFANGGMPNRGDLFIANEMGAEMVGSMNGRTVVANNQQIVEGIKAGVVDAMMEVMIAMQNGNNNSGQNIEIPMYVDGRELARATYINMESMIRGGQIRPSWT